MIGANIVSFKSASLVRNSWPTQDAEALEGHLRANEICYSAHQGIPEACGCIDINRYCAWARYKAAASLSRD